MYPFVVCDFDVWHVFPSVQSRRRRSRRRNVAEQIDRSCVDNFRFAGAFDAANTLQWHAKRLIVAHQRQAGVVGVEFCNKRKLESAKHGVEQNFDLQRMFASNVNKGDLTSSVELEQRSVVDANRMTISQRNVFDFIVGTFKETKSQKKKTKQK